MGDRRFLVGVGAGTRALVALLALLFAPLPARGEILLPAGFTAHVYVTGSGFEATGTTGSRGVPSASTLAFDDAATLYVARTGRRYFAGEQEDLNRIYRIPAGGARVTPETEARYLYGPPLPNPQIGVVRGREVLVTTFDRERKIGVLYRMIDGRALRLAGGTPPAGTPALLRQPEGVGIDTEGRIYVADREQGLVVRLDASGGVSDRRYLALPRPRLLVTDGDTVWVTSDRGTDAPWQQGVGEIRKIDASGRTTVQAAPILAGLALGATGHVFAADRAGGRVFVVTPDGRTFDFARFTDGDAPRGLVFAPDTPAARLAGIAGQLFVITIRRGVWSANEIVRITGPFEDFLRQHE